MSRNAIFGALAVLVSALVAVLAIEVFVRTAIDDGMQLDIEMWKYARDVKQVSADPLIGHEHQPNRNVRLMGVDFSTNSKGLRDREISVERVAGTKRILMLGDSITVGWGVPFEETFSKRLEAMLRAKGETIEVINTGVGNYNTTQEVQFFLTRGKEYRPDIVILNYFVNDAEPVPRSAPPSLLQRHCMSCMFIKGRLDSLGRTFAPGTDWAGYYLGLFGQGDAPGWKQSRAEIERLAAFCKANNIRLIIANTPELRDIVKYRFEHVTEMVRKTAQDAGVEFVDLRPTLAGVAESRLWVTAPDPHPNAFANRFFAQGLFDYLETRK